MILHMHGCNGMRCNGWLLMDRLASLLRGKGLGIPHEPILTLRLWSLPDPLRDSLGVCEQDECGDPLAFGSHWTSQCSKTLVNQLTPCPRRFGY